MPLPYKSILCPIDFDDSSARAIREAAALALHSGGALHILHVVQFNPLTSQGAAEGFAAQEMYDEQVAFARKQAEKMLENLPKGVKHELIIEIGEPGDSIVVAAEKLRADLVVMATHARSGLKRLVMGSVDERVLCASSTPVLIVPPSPQEQV
jgi:nucleotide-binding universal stress UspA family protein